MTLNTMTLAAFAVRWACWWTMHHLIDECPAPAGRECQLAKPRSRFDVHRRRDLECADLVYATLVSFIVFLLPAACSPRCGRENSSDAALAFILRCWASLAGGADRSARSGRH